jgi:hypothetical protein
VGTQLMCTACIFSKCEMDDNGGLRKYLTDKVYDNPPPQHKYVIKELYGSNKRSVTPAGFEPTTFGSGIQCSTN